MGDLVVILSLAGPTACAEPDLLRSCRRGVRDFGRVAQGRAQDCFCALLLRDVCDLHVSASGSGFLNLLLRWMEDILIPNML